VLTFAARKNLVGQLTVLLFGTSGINNPKHDVGLIQLLEASFDA
jgi:hypothetical protein